MPHWPDRAAAKASCHWSAGKRWELTDRPASRHTVAVTSNARIPSQYSYISTPSMPFLVLIWVITFPQSMQHGSFASPNTPP